MVFLVKGNKDSIRYALKRLYVNNEQDLNVAKREIQIAVSSNLFEFISTPIPNLCFFLCVFTEQSDRSQKHNWIHRLKHNTNWKWCVRGVAGYAVL